MYITLNTIIMIGGALSVLGTMIGVILKVHKWYLKVEAVEKRCDEQEKQHKEDIAELKKHHSEDIAELKKHHSEDIIRVNTENTMICYALSACLNGLQQLGANGDVTEAKEKLDKFLNKQAHK